MNYKEPIKELFKLGLIDDDVYHCFYLTEEEKKENKEEISKSKRIMISDEVTGHFYSDVINAQLIKDLKRLIKTISRPKHRVV